MLQRCVRHRCSVRREFNNWQCDVCCRSELASVQRFVCLRCACDICERCHNTNRDQQNCNEATVILVGKEFCLDERFSRDVFANIAVLDLSQCSLATISGLSKLKLLRILDLTANHFNAMPRSVKKLCNLEVLKLSHNRIETFDASILKSLTRLRSLAVRTPLFFAMRYH
jgi:hypothetical protein